MMEILNLLGLKSQAEWIHYITLPNEEEGTND